MSSEALSVKVTICNDCGLTMNTGVTVCRRCNQKRVASYEISASDEWVVNKRVNELNPYAGKPHTHPYIAGIAVVALTAIAGIAYELYAHPGAIVGRNTKAAIASTKSAIAALTPKHKSADGKLTASGKNKAKSM
jgi:uncharacterized OB-fold protein